MTKPADDFEAVRLVVGALEPFDSKDRERIIRWAVEKLGMPSASALATIPSPPQQPTPAALSAPASTGSIGQSKDIRSFINLKNPRSAIQLTAVVAYYHHFEAPQRLDAIGKEELLDACRKADRTRPKRPDQVLVDAFHAGLLDKAGVRGQYKLNSVGENLVAMVLPEKGQNGEALPAKRAKARTTSAKPKTSPSKKK